MSGPYAPVTQEKLDAATDKPLPAAQKLKTNIDDFLTGNVVEPLAQRGYPNLGAALATVPSVAAEMMIPSTTGELQGAVIPIPGMKKALKKLDDLELFHGSKTGLSKIKDVEIPDENSVTLYHGSQDPSLTKVNESSGHGFFDSIFGAKNYDDAMDHGKHVYEIQLKKDQILEDIPETPEVLSIIKDQTKLKNRENDPDYDRDLNLLWSIVGLEKSSGNISQWVDFNDYKKAPKDADNFELLYHNNKITKQIEENICNLLGEKDPMMAWHEAQRIRGVIAKKLGYKAVSTQDEHGVSYMILPGNKIKKIER